MEKKLCSMFIFEKNIEDFSKKLRNVNIVLV